ncbi:MAG: hypothetical protein CMB29_02725 [Euryarchaeota archaeon]|nr:hypothetical protein [Euryarchaeota archaeon]DAC31690.1 MAG TPA: hypothetical protein D7H81_00950 [Candidatus Poseidoniales archaeon]HII44586.1 hypothetical protein [Candidatus Poseidoniaceae archaeon]
MARQLLQHCKKCGAWTLQRDCPHCDEIANAAAPIKWSPEDQRANIRRKMYDVESPEWLTTLPNLKTITDSRKAILEEE